MSIANYFELQTKFKFFIESLNVAKNQISGELPDSLGLLSKLREFISFLSRAFHVILIFYIFEHTESLAIYSNDITGIMLPSVCNNDADYLAADCDKILCDCCTHCCNEVDCDATNSPTESFYFPPDTNAPTKARLQSVSLTFPPTQDLNFEFPTFTIPPTTASPTFIESANPSDYEFKPTASRSPVTLSPSATDAITAMISSVSDVSDTSSSQYQALQWVLDDAYYSSDLDVYQRYALMTMYYSFNGTGWTNDNRWGTSSTECNWFGVGCDVEMNVTELNLRKFFMLNSH